VSAASPAMVAARPHDACRRPAPPRMPTATGTAWPDCASASRSTPAKPASFSSVTHSYLVRAGSSRGRWPSRCRGPQA
jgi:hypothetical protein